MEQLKQQSSLLRTVQSSFTKPFDAESLLILIAKTLEQSRARRELLLAWYRDILGQASESVGIRYGQRVPVGWTTHDLRHTCLTNLAMAGVPINGIKEYAGHASIVETQRYLKFMPQSI